MLNLTTLVELTLHSQSKDQLVLRVDIPSKLIHTHELRSTFLLFSLLHFLVLSSAVQVQVVL